MKSVFVSDLEDPVMVKTKARVVDALLAKQAGVRMACGGKGLCATCHVYVERGAERLTPRTPREELALQMLSTKKPNSRLSCQAKVLGEGVLVSIPKGKHLESSKDLVALVGRRAENPILHPVTGAVLVEEGKIITRSRIMELSTVDLDIAEMKARSSTIAVE